MRGWNLAITYKPKIEGVFAGRVRKTTRGGWKRAPKDNVHLFTWTGKPYRSPWGRRLDAYLVDVVDVIYAAEGIRWIRRHTITELGITYHMELSGYLTPWVHPAMDELAVEEGIDPPTGVEYGRVLASLGAKDGEEMQILEWMPLNTPLKPI